MLVTEVVETPVEASSKAAKADRFTATYVYLCLLCFLLIVFSEELDRIFNLWLLMVPILLVPVCLLFIALVSSISVNAARGRWRRAASALLAPFLAAVPLVFCYQLGITPTWVRFQLSRAHYEREIARMQAKDGAPRLRAFDWGELGGVAVANIFYTLVFDESGEVGLPPGQRSAAWLERAGQQPQLYSVLQGKGDPSVRFMGNHFYLVKQVYQ